MGSRESCLPQVILISKICRQTCPCPQDRTSVSIRTNKVCNISTTFNFMYPLILSCSSLILPATLLTCKEAFSDLMAITVPITWKGEGYALQVLHFLLLLSSFLLFCDQI